MSTTFDESVSNKNYEVILFDVDDTLFDFKRSEHNAFHHTFMQFGFTEALTQYRKDYHEISKVLWDHLEQGKMTLDELAVERFRKLFRHHQLDINPEDFSTSYLRYLGRESHLMKGAVDVCHKLSAYRLAVVTNGFTIVQLERIKNSPLKNSFEQIIISQQVGAQKPQQHIFDVTFSRLNISDPSKVLMVGDSLTSDIQGGRNYGIDTCWFNPLQLENNQQVKPTYEINHLADLLSILPIH